MTFLRCFGIFIVLILIGIPSYSQNVEREDLSPLEITLSSVMDGQTEPAEYYKQFNNSKIFFLVAESNLNKTEGGIAQFAIRATPYEDAYLVDIFDTKQKAESYADKFGFSKSEIQSGVGASLVVADKAFYLLLNPETKYQKLFVPDEIKLLAALSVPAEQHVIDAEKFATLKPVDTIEEEVLGRVLGAVEELTAIKRVYAFENPLAAKSTDGRANYLFVMQVNKDTNQEILSRAFYEHIKIFIESGQFVDAMFISKKYRKKNISRTHQPIFKR